MRPRRSLSDAWRARIALAVLALLLLLDRDGCLVANQASVFSFVIGGLEWLWNAMSGAGGFIAVHLEAVVSWLTTSLSWLAKHVANILSSTGAMFARVWRALQVYYEEFWKPLGEWLYDQVKRFYDWLKAYLQPVFDFLKRVRDELLTIYKRFVRPILDAIDIARAILKTLGDLGIEWAQALDVRLGQFESIVTENFLRIVGELNRVINAVDSVITLDFLFKRAPWLLTLKRDLGPVVRYLTSARSRAISEHDARKLAAAWTVKPPAETMDDIVGWLNDETNDSSASLDELRKTFLGDWPTAT